MRLTPAFPTPLDVPAALVPQADSASAAPASPDGFVVPDTTGPIATLDDIPEQPLEGLDRIMLAEDRLPVVLAVVLVVWVGVVLMLARTDRRLRRLERELHDDRELRDAQ